MNTKKILVIAHNLYIGGIASYLVQLTNYLISCGHDVTMVYTNADEACLDAFSPKVHRNKIGQNSRIKVLLGVVCSRNFFRFLFAGLKNDRLGMTQIYSLIDAKKSEKINGDFDVAISSEEFFCNDYLAFNTNASRRIGWIHPDYQSIHPNRSIDAEVFRKLDRVCVVSQTNLALLQHEYPGIRDKFVFVENILDKDRILAKSKETVRDFDYGYSGIKIVTVCRLDNSSKRLDRVVGTCAYLKTKGVHFKWYIVGDGKDRASLEALIAQHDVGDVLILLGRKENPYPYYANADVFVLTSQYEGKPISVEEAKILHCPVIVTRYASADEQVKDSFGTIIPNSDDRIPEQLYSYLQTEQLRKWKMSISSYDYDPQLIYSVIDSLIE